MKNFPISTTMLRRVCSIACVIGISLICRPAWAQVSYQSLEDTYSQNFDSLPSSGTSFTWTDNASIPGWYAANTGSVSFNPAGISAGATTNGNLYSFGSASASDRALGSIGSGSSNAGGFYYGVKFVNETGVTINAITITYTGEQWRNSAAAAQTVSFQYSLSATGIKTGSYVSVPQLDFTSPITGGTAGSANGNSGTARRTIGPITITDIYWPPNGILWIRWSDPDQTGFDHGLAIDDFSLHAAGASEQYDPPAGYYGSAQGLLGHDLEVALHNIVSPHVVIPYSSSTNTDTWAALKILDEDPFDATKVKLFYSTSSALKSDNGVTWNREHLWPKSRGIDDSGPDASDLFNIRPAASAVNSARGNKIFDNSDPLDSNYHMPAYPSAGPDTSTDSNSWQPPADQKGDVARALFYMHVRYDGNLMVDPATTDLTLGENVTNTNNMAVLSTLLQWHRSDPVSDEERRRNQLIYTQFQHNRNPFVDNPDYAESLFNELQRSLEDPDLDGLPSSWELANQFDPSNPIDAAQDRDGDGFTNFEEYWMGSDPGNPASPTVITVDANYTGATETGSATTPFKRIQSAIDVVPASELRAIVVRPGVYNERLYANGKSRIHVFSQTGAGQTIIDGQQVNSSVVRLYNFDKATFSGFTIRNSLTDWVGAGLRVEAPGGAILIDSNILTNNVTTATSTTGGGGGLYLKTARGSRVTNNFITNNQAVRGGGILFAAGDAECWHNTIAGNNATGGLGGGLSALTGVKPDVRNNIIWSNTGLDPNSQVYQIVGTNNIIQGAPTGSGNFAFDPKFVSPAQNDYHIAVYSPARNNAIPVPLKVDFDFSPRPEISLARSDIGAHEVSTVDADGNGVPDYWELEHYGTLDQRETDYDGDGLTNALEFQYGTDPSDDDSDNDGLKDGEEIVWGTDPLTADSDSDGDGRPDLVDLWPSDYFNGVLPTIATLAGENQARVTNTLWPDPVVIRVTDSFGQLLTNAPLHISASPTGATFATSLTAPFTSDLLVRTGADGTARIYIKSPVIAAPFAIMVSAISGANSKVLPIAEKAVYSPSIAAGEYHTVALGSSGTVWAWGLNSSGQLGDGTNLQRSLPSPVIGLSDVKAIAAGAYHTLALKRDGTVWAWGANLLGQLGNGNNSDSRTPVRVGELSNIVAIAVGSNHNLALRSDGTVYAWGLNSNGQLGDGTILGRNTPVIVSGLSGSAVVSISAGAYHSLALMSDGTVRGWGANFYGAIGGTAVQSVAPVTVPLTNVSKLVGGAYHTMAITTSGTGTALGWNGYGQLGDNTNTSRATAAPITNLSSIAEIAASQSVSGHCIALSGSGSPWTWGGNSFGQLGIQNTIDKWSPQSVPSPTGIVSVAAGSSHTVVLQADGTIYTWGYNQFGQLGDGTTMDRALPIKKEGLCLLPSAIDTDQDALPDTWELDKIWPS